jgi:hypothetical protein
VTTRNCCCVLYKSIHEDVHPDEVEKWADTSEHNRKMRRLWRKEMRGKIRRRKCKKGLRRKESKESVGEGN